MVKNSMLNIPYISSPKNACALACYTMVAQYFFPQTTFSQIAAIVDWQPGYIAWAFKFWLWLMDKNIKIENYDLLDLQQWAENGVAGLRKTTPPKEFAYYQQHSFDLAALSQHIPTLLQQQNFTYHQQKPTWDDLTKALQEKKICEVVLDSHTLDQIPGFALHRVVILDINEQNQTIIFHDPRPTPRPARQEKIALFKKAWLENVQEPELCMYRRNEG